MELLRYEGHGGRYLDCWNGRCAGSVRLLMRRGLAGPSVPFRIGLTALLTRGASSRLRVVAFALCGWLFARLRGLGRLLLRLLRGRGRCSVGTILPRCLREDRARKTIIVARLRLTPWHPGEHSSRSRHEGQIACSHHAFSCPQAG